jgi:EmrB/QacA subfamily drug resistance transporter
VAKMGICNKSGVNEPGILGTGREQLLAICECGGRAQKGKTLLRKRSQWRLLGSMQWRAVWPFLKPGYGLMPSETNGRSAAHPASKGHSLPVLVATIGASSMAFLDGSIVQIALPAIQADFGADFVTLQWVVNVYVLMLGSLVLVGGAYGDQIGRRCIFLIGTSLFVAASLFCGLAPSALLLVWARALQGIGAALLVPQSLAIIAASFPPQVRGGAIGIWAAASALTAAIGPPIGGFLVDSLSWRAVFLVNVPIGVTVLLVTLGGVPESRSPMAKSVDLGGGALAILSLGGLATGLVYFPDRGSGDALVEGAFGLSIAALAAFLLWESRTAYPMVPLNLFANRLFARTNLLTLFLYGSFVGTLFLIPYTLIGLYKYSATRAGLALLPLGLSIASLARFFGVIGDRYGVRKPLIGGTFLVAAATAWLALSEAAGPYLVGTFGPILCLGIGMAMVITPLTTTVMNALDQNYAGTASGINNAAGRIAALLAIAVIAALMAEGFAGALQRQLVALQIPADLAEALLSKADRVLAVPLPDGLATDQAALLRQAIGAAYRTAFRYAMAFNFVLASAALLVALGLPSGRLVRPQ